VSELPVLQRLTLLAALLICVVGCETVGDVLKRPDANRDDQPLARALDRQIDELNRLGSAPFDERIELFRQIELDYIDNPGDANRLRLALAKSVEGHPSTDLRSAVDEIAALLGQSNTLSPTQIYLASMTARDVESSIALNNELQQLRARVNKFEQSSSARTSRDDRLLRTARARVLELEVQNANLAEELAQARRQLDAIMSIETSSDPGN